MSFKVVNGSWNEGEREAATAEKTADLAVYKGETLKLAPTDIPTVGDKPDDTYKAGGWDVTPNPDAEITDDTTYTYTYEKKETAAVTTAPTAETLTYREQAQALVTASEASGGSMVYALGEDADTAPAAEQFTSSIPSDTDAGT